MTERIECPWCGGAGQVKASVQTSQWHTKYDDCPKCNGTKKIEPDMQLLQQMQSEASRERARLEVKHKDIMDIPASMCDRLVYPTELITSSGRNLRITCAIIELKKSLHHDDEKIVDRLAVSD